MYITKQILNQQSRSKEKAHKKSLFNQIKIKQYLIDSFSSRKKRISSNFGKLSAGSSPNHNHIATIYRHSGQQQAIKNTNCVQTDSGQRIKTQLFDQICKQRNTVNHLNYKQSLKQIEYAVSSIRSISEQSQRQQNFQNSKKPKQKFKKSKSRFRIKLQKLANIKQQSVIESKLHQIIDISRKFSKRKIASVFTQDQEDRLRTQMFRKTMLKCGRQKHVEALGKTMRQFTINETLYKRKIRKTHLSKQTHIGQTSRIGNRFFFTEKSDNSETEIKQQSVLPVCATLSNMQLQSEPNQTVKDFIKQSVSQKCLNLQMDQQDNKERINFRKYVLHSIANLKTQSKINQTTRQLQGSNSMSASQLKQNIYVKTTKRLQQTKNISQREIIKGIKRMIQIRGNKPQIDLNAEQNLSLGASKSLININARKGLLQQNCYMLQKFIRGGVHYDHDGYSDYASLSYLNQTKQNFQTFSDLYKNVKESYKFTNLSLEDLVEPNLQSMVFLNQKIKDITKSKQEQVCKRLKVVR